MTLGRKSGLLDSRRMRGLFVLASVVGLCGSGCARLNPEFGLEEGTTGGAETAGGSTRAVPEIDDTSGGASTAVSDSAVDGSDLGPGPHVCGNGKLEPGEACDDGNLEWGDGCDEVCSTEPLLNWVYELDFEDGIAERFNDVVLVGDVVVAAGRGEDRESGDQQVLVVALDSEDGAPLDELLVPLGIGTGGEARGVAAVPGEVYYAGRTNEPGVDALLGTVALGNDGSFGPTSELPIAGTRAKGIAFRGPDVLVTNGFYNNDGLGFTTCSSARGCEGWVLNEAGSQLDAVVVSGEQIFVAGLRQGSPHIFEVVEPTSEMGLVPLFDDGRPGRFQALAIRGDILYAAGSVVSDGDEDAWIVAYSLSKSVLLWEDQIDEGSMLDDEFEDVAVTEDGSVVVVGMLGTPPVPVVFEYGPQGQPRWGLSIEPEMGVDSGHARGVAVRGDEIYVAGEWRETYSPGDGADGTGVGFVARIRR